MDMDALVDLIRAMAKKCERVEDLQRSSEMYERWYKQERKKVKAYEAKYGSIVVESED